MESKLDFLRKYRNDVELVAEAMLDKEKKDEIPDYWLGVFKENNIETKIKK